MPPSLQRFGHYLISRRANGSPVVLDRSEDEIVFLAFDTHIRRLVELHILKGGDAMNAVEKRSALERALVATDVRGTSFMRVLEAGDDEGVVYFTSNLNDGEFADAYVARRGPLPAMTVFCLMQGFLDDLVAAKSFDRLVSHMRMSNPLVTTLEDAFLQLRIVDYGLSEREQRADDAGLRRVFSDCCRLIFLLLTGQPYDGQNPDKFPALTSLPTNLRAHVRSALTDASEASPNLEKLRDEVKEAYAAQVTSLQARTSRKHIAVTEAFQPQSSLQQVLLENVSAEELLKGRFEVANGDDVRRYPFSIPAKNTKTEMPLTVQLLPPTRIVERSEMEAVPLQMWRFSPDRHPNILRSLSLWENPEWTFLTEEREPGFTLSRLMAERGSFNPPEVLAILKQMRAGMDQAAECGVNSVDLHPSNLIFRVGKGGAMQSREFEKLMLKRIDAWPPFVLKLRTHMTMRSLYEPPIVEPHEEGQTRDPVLSAHDLRCRTFVGLGIYLLTGERQVGSTPQFGETVPEALAAYLRECLESQKKFNNAVEPNDFIAAFESHMALEDPEGRGFAAIRNASKVAHVEMESAGAVSDFDDDEFGHFGGDQPDYLVAPESQKLGVATIREKPMPARGVIGMALWGLAAVIIGLLALLFFSWGNSQPNYADAASTTAVKGTKTEAKATDVAAKASDAAPDAAVSDPDKPKDGEAPAKPVSKPIRPRLPEEIRKAQLPSMTEVERALRDKRSGTAPNKSSRAATEGELDIVEGSSKR